MASQLKTNIRTVFGIIEMVLFSGVIFGWANLVLVLKEEKYFKDLCADGDNGNTSLRKESSDDSEKCGKQDERLALIFTLSVFAFNVAGFIAGALLDKLGTRFVRLIGCFFFLLTGIFAIVLEKETANLMFPLIICLAFAGMCVAISVFQIAVLHTKHQFIISSSLSGALDSSSVVFLVFKLLYDAGVGIRWIFVGYVALAIFCILVSTFFLLPKTSIAAEQVGLEVCNEAVTPDNVGDQEMTIPKSSAKQKDSNREKSRVELGISNQAVTPDTVGDQAMTIQSVGNIREFDDINLNKEPENDKPVENGSTPERTISQDVDKFASGWRYILTAKYLWLLYFFSLIQLRLWFFVGSLNSYLVYHTHDDKDKIETYSEIFGLTQFFGFIFAPFTGLIMNMKPRNITNAYFGPTLSFIITLLLCVIMGGLVLVPVLDVQVRK
ncbi:solute carrier family 43 member 3 isoform X2 [Paramuricea clavata]|uniref:Solute carrier family 43 member 3 isoform X2 n=1 Tax=Paramuricea clavata TaxID=317549 RepID=A0A6S7HUK3_PARCT|nr:solute carrier family 43 member 3 isoform X2 [Paramuricea clavata]